LHPKKYNKEGELPLNIGKEGKKKTLFPCKNSQREDGNIYVIDSNNV
jgi:hypothetical protein